MTNASNTTFVCCVESGSLESYTVRMVESLRRYGGKFANAPVIAVTPRFGPPLTRSTLKKFKELNVQYVRSRIKTNYPWFKFLNKPLALVAAEEYATTEAMGWLDSDLLFVAEPEKLELLSSEDFLGFPVECKEMGTKGPGDPMEPLWQEFCKAVGLNIDELPWVTTAETNERVRFYFNGGIFVYRRSTGLAHQYLKTCLTLLDTRIGTNTKGYSEGIKEMISIGFAVQKMGLIWRSLPYSHDYVMSSQTHDAWYKEESLRAAKIVHFHDSMWPKFWPVFTDCLRKTHPEVEAWLQPFGPVGNPAPVQWRIVNTTLRKLRLRAETAYKKSCRIV